ncbi:MULTISPECIES: methyl-accepting chemotaxis protein [unclassified Candidatus Frackibacter]|uniref:methyl-accepting chemotaxis protein n=1 Tax=unclassified Candidatus Frackibacter TaxID=2648818 RepID=UPI00088FE4E9|nr:MULTISPECIES: methyl-accepting chemotaxis protein [unclassified Candidatus Frackibacter]SDC34267.1 Methyl-accepting chemotaxis protein [Candidatus Frackibacter sp. WG11]SEM56980.1 Methyl-accepting chemotaxis protein [Candidatus Frackibacter sp. WG12]SFL70283.1 Methyl-accepting chemotaxis protein [Candidatus Frackibacter sp. WG13]
MIKKLLISFKGMKVKTKLLVGFSAIIVMLLLLAGSLFYFTNGIGRDIREFNHYERLAENIERIEVSLKDEQLAAMELVGTNEKDEIDDFNKAVKNFSSARRNLDNLLKSKENKEKINQIVKEHNLIIEGFEQQLVVEWRNGANNKVLQNLIEERIDNSGDKIIELLKEVTNKTNTLLKESRQEMKENLSFFKVLMLTILAFVILFGLGIIIIISKDLSNSLNKIIESLNKAEAGDLTVSIENDCLEECWEIMGCNKEECPAYQSDNLRCWQVGGTHCGDEIQGDMASKLDNCEDCKVYQAAANSEMLQIAEAFNNMMVRLRDMTVNVKESAGEVSSTSQELSASSEQVTASVEEVAASAQQFASNIDQLSEHAQMMSKNADEVNALAQDGLEQMGSTQQEMEDILSSSEQSQATISELNKASEEIGDIVEVISDIADQTNLLALNAAIEAARAGEQGKGFAVVAEEVRELAASTQDSVNNIRNIIDGLVVKTGEAVEIIEQNNSQIKTGAETLDETGEAFKDIAIRIGEVVTQIQEVASTGEQLAVGSKEISSATEEQSASMEQISSSAQQLAGMAEELNSLVDQFDA